MKINKFFFITFDNASELELTFHILYFIVQMIVYRRKISYQNTSLNDNP